MLVYYSMMDYVLLSNFPEEQDLILEFYPLNNATLIYLKHILKPHYPAVHRGECVVFARQASVLWPDNTNQ